MTDEKALATYDEQLAALAAQAAADAKDLGGGRKYISHRGGKLRVGDDVIPGNAIAAAILDAVPEHVYYRGRYDPDNPEDPTCFAVGRLEGLAPHADAAKPQAHACAECKLNRYGSADTGRGKACANKLRIAVVSVGGFDRHGNFEASERPGDEIAYMSIPVTSVALYVKFARSCASAHQRPPLGVVAKIAPVEDPKTQYKVTFEALGLVENEWLPTLLRLREECQEDLYAPYASRSGVGEAEEDDVAF